MYCTYKNIAIPSNSSYLKLKAKYMETEIQDKKQRRRIRGEKRKRIYKSKFKIINKRATLF